MPTLRHAPRFVALIAAVLALTSCGGAGEGESDERSVLGTVRQAITDSDADGMDDGWETSSFGSLAQTAAGDFDSDGMTNLEEYTHGFNPTVADGLLDRDFDRYPDVFEVRAGSNPNSAASIPSPTYTVNAAGGGTHTTIAGAISSATTANGQYQIIGIAPGTYTGTSNAQNLTIASTKPKLLIIGLEGAGKTIIDGGLGNWGWTLNNTAVVASLTFRKTWLALYVDAPGKELRFVDLIVRDNATTSWATGVHVNAASAVHIIGSTFLDNTGMASAQQIWFGSGAGTLVNTAVTSAGSGTMLAKAASATLTTSYSFVKGQTLTGTGNLAGSTVPKLRSDAHLLWDSPLRGAGGTVTQSRVDLDGEARPSTTPDIGVDQFVDSDADSVADSFELAETGNLTTLTSRTQDADSDGLTNEQEYAAFSKPTVADTDGDGLSDGAEVNTHLTNPLTADTDGDDMPDGWEVTYGLAPLVANGLADDDGDRYPNVFEYAGGTNPADRASIPSPTYTVNAAGGGTHTTFSAALAAANVANGQYQIIGFAPGVYTGASNTRNLTIASTKPKLLVIGLEGAAKTIIDSENLDYGWNVKNAAVVASLTFRNTWQALYVDAPGKEVRLVDLVIRNNATTLSWAAAVHVNAAAQTYLVSSTLVDNAGMASAQQVWIGSGAATIVNTVVTGQASGTMLAKAASATLTTNYSHVKGQTLTGTGNLAGSTVPKVRADGRLLWDSPLRGAGGVIAQSRFDLDGELRPSSAPDIGADQFLDTDSDQVADAWEQSETGGLATLTGRTQDADGDGLTNDQEYARVLKPTVADTDGDGLSDGAEVNTYLTSPTSTDSDGDDMPDGWEVTYGLSPLVANGYEDSDGDKVPNAWEFARGSNPADRASTPTPNYLVNGAGGGTHTTVSAAVSAATVANGAYQIIAIAPGTYSGFSNDVTLSASKPKLLVIGLEGAGKTIIDGAGADYGWNIWNGAVVSSLTFRNWLQAFQVNAPGSEVRLVDLIIRDNANATYAGAIDVISASKFFLVGSTLVDNVGPTASRQVLVQAGTATIQNTVLWGQGTGTMLAKSAGATLVTSNCLVKGQTLTGTGNLAGSLDPKLRSDAHLLWDSPLRGAGASVPQSRIDLDGELRPSTPDIGVDQFNDSDSDQLADQWELDAAGNLTALTGRAQDADGDGLSNESEYANRTNPVASDTDGDGLSDSAELLTYASNPLASDTDGDDMPDGWEATHGLAVTVADGLADGDGDRVPNVWEFAGGSSPVDRTSTPAPNFVVNAAGGGTHTTIGDAVSAATLAGGAYQIIAVAPGTYSGTSNDVTLPSNKPKFLVLGLEGAAKTIIDGTGGNYGWNIWNTAVVSSLTFRNWYQAFQVNAPGGEVRLVDLIIRNNSNASYAGAVDVISASKFFLVGSTLLDNVGPTASRQILVQAGTATIQNTVLWGQGTGTMLAKSAGATLVTNNCLVKGQTLTGTGNLAGTVDPKLRSDLRLRSDSPLRGAGAGVAQSRIDVDGELRPSTPDIGVDQFNDGDADGLPDAWELANAGATSAVTGSGDQDADGLSNLAEHDLETDWLDPDTDHDGLLDGTEVAIATNPFVADSDDLTGDMNHDGVVDSVGAQLGYQPTEADSDGDSVSNADELLACTNPLRADTDGDGVPDSADAFPLDPLMSALPSTSGDVTAPVITLTAPWYAVAQ